MKLGPSETHALEVLTWTWVIVISSEFHLFEIKAIHSPKHYIVIVRYFLTYSVVRAWSAVWNCAITQRSCPYIPVVKGIKKTQGIITDL